MYPGRSFVDNVVSVLFQFRRFLRSFLVYSLTRSDVLDPILAPLVGPTNCAVLVSVDWLTTDFNLTTLSTIFASVSSWLSRTSS
jgi:hypothetical protein